jgi:integrase/recombinase XerD
MIVFLKEYLSVLKLEKNLSDNTLNSYKNDLTKFLDYASGEAVDDLSGISASLISKYFEIQRKIGLGSTTTARYLSSLHGFFNYLMENKYIETNPMDKIPSAKIARNLPPFSLSTK